jgi:hypothetical protein
MRRAPNIDGRLGIHAPAGVDHDLIDASGHLLEEDLPLGLSEVSDSWIMSTTHEESGRIPANGIGS